MNFIPENKMLSGKKKIIVKVTIPMIITDNPMCCFTSRDGKFIQEVPVNQQIVKWLRGKHEGYFELWLSSTHIISMKPVSDTLYYAEEKSDEAEQQS